MIFPYGQKNPPESFPFATCILIFLNILLFIATCDGFEITERAIDTLAYSSVKSDPARLFSSMFLHGDWFHLAGNMWFLWLFGFSVEGRLRTWRFVPLYLLSGLGATFLQGFASVSNAPQIGASGAIMGVMGAALWMFPFAKMKVFYWFGWFFVGTWEWFLYWLALLYFGMDLFMAYATQPFETATSGGTAHWAHVGGAVAGFVLAIALRGKRDSKSVSSSKEHIYESGDLTRLNRTELVDLAALQPDNYLIATPWLRREAEFGKVPFECSNFFRKHIAEILENEDPALIGSAVFLGLVTNLAPTTIPPAIAIQAALACDKRGNPQGAMVIFGQVLKMPNATDSDLETATFRLAQVREMWFADTAGAHALYKEFLDRWPMSPFASRAKERMNHLSTRLPPPGAW